MARFPALAARNRATAVVWAGSKLGQPGSAASGPVIHLTQPRRHGTIAALPDVLLQALLCLPSVESLVMVECAYNRGELDLAFLRGHLTGNRCGKARDVLARVERGADLLLETLARVLFREAGIATAPRR